MKEKVLFFDIDGTLVCSQMGIYEIPLANYITKSLSMIFNKRKYKKYV